MTKKRITQKLLNKEIDDTRKWICSIIAKAMKIKNITPRELSNSCRGNVTDCYIEDIVTGIAVIDLPTAAILFYILDVEWGAFLPETEET
jgi:hypothetical protein